jgi:hypothetical protein
MVWRVTGWSGVLRTGLVWRRPYWYGLAQGALVWCGVVQ